MLCGHCRMGIALAAVMLTALPAAAQQRAPAGGSGMFRFPGMPVQKTAARDGVRGQPQRMPPQPRQELPPPELRLTPNDQAVVAMVLAEWEKHNKEIKTFSCNFTMWEYNNQLRLNPQAPGGPIQHSGRLSYAAPDRGMYQVDPDASGNGGEHWICDGKSVFEVRHAPEKKIIERPLPENLRGKAIADAPLPFVFGSSAEKMQRRFWMRVSTPQNNFTDIELEEGQVLLEAWPRTQNDRANFQMVQIIFNEKDMLPFAINEFLSNHHPKNEQRLTYLFEEPSVNSPLEAIKNFFVNPTKKFGYKLIVEKPPAEEAVPLQPQIPSANLRNRVPVAPPRR